MNNLDFAALSNFNHFENQNITRGDEFKGVAIKESTLLSVRNVVGETLKEVLYLRKNYQP